MNEFRRTLRLALDQLGGVRPAALRRSRTEDSLYATDLPQLTDEATWRQFLSGLEKKGWQGRTAQGWLLLGFPAQEPPEGGFAGPFGPEAACCLSLLDRHDADRVPEEPDEETVNLRYRLIKAGEEGPEAYERLCGAIHGEWAARLRQHRALPLISRTFFGGQLNRR